MKKENKAWKRSSNNKAEVEVEETQRKKMGTTRRSWMRQRQRLAEEEENGYFPPHAHGLCQSLRFVFPVHQSIAAFRAPPPLPLLCRFPQRVFRAHFFVVHFRIYLFCSLQELCSRLHFFVHHSFSLLHSLSLPLDCLKAHTHRCSFPLFVHQSFFQHPLLLFACRCRLQSDPAG